MENASGWLNHMLSLQFFRIQKTIDRYRRSTYDMDTYKTNLDQCILHLKQETTDMERKIELLEVSLRKLSGECLGSCSIDEIQMIGDQLERSLSSIRARKAQLFDDQIQHLQAKERSLKEENAKLLAKVNPLSHLCCYCFPTTCHASSLFCA
ncbi:hypothetical protein EUGRSUZ_K00208 [Eucalyptus grandis]|uniref:Uncharacterized protein n=2 Tax=Eucalyptus grandis TaxID=71139 RepID=A0ACC3IPS8_EUCGR|nr:hypothetical protein EUGRSUZ_K00208 [Eucalyptus grandis]